jgi:hypothetical protein
MNEAIDTTAVEESHELVPSQPSTLWRTDDPAEVLKRATETANALKSVLDQQGMVQNIAGRGHVRVEGWTTLGSMLGVTPVCVWTRRLTEPDGWEARVEARTLDGRVIGAAEAECLRGEKRWKTADDYALRSMSQTRATSKALGSVLRFVVTLAGYSGTPAEEVDSWSTAAKDIVGLRVELLELADRLGNRDEVAAAVQENWRASSPPEHFEWLERQVERAHEAAASHANGSDGAEPTA